jgi:hypothetical protein
MIDYKTLCRRGLLQLCQQDGQRMGKRGAKTSGLRGGQIGLILSSDETAQH